MGFVVYNVGTGSTVSHTESSLGVEPFDMVWEHREQAELHARTLTAEYSIAHPELPEGARTWRVRPATAKQVERAKLVAAFGKDYEDVIGTGQARAHILNPDKIPEAREEMLQRRVREFGQEIDRLADR